MLTLTLDQIIAISASLAGGLSALATLFTVLQISIQRRESYRPELVFSTTKFDTSAEQNSHSLSQQLHHDFKVTIHNIGLGAAKNLKITWSFPIEIAVEKVNILTAKGVNLEIYKFEKNVLSSTGGETKDMMSMWANQQIQLIDFALPATVNSQPISILIPHAYSTLWLAYYSNLILQNNLSKTTDFPPLKSTITYQDIGGAKHKIEQLLTITLSSFIHNKRKASGFISSKSIN